MVFTPNPLALSVPEAEFESWLRDSGYLEIIDQRTTDLHRLSFTTPTSAAVDTTTSAAATNSILPNKGFFSLFSPIWTLLSLFTFNPFSKLTTDDFSCDTPPWTTAFFGSSDSYSFPSSPAQVRLRVHENVKRFARNYASLFVLFFACSLYQLPIALVGLMSCLALWDVFKFVGDRWKLDRYPVLREVLIRIVQCELKYYLSVTSLAEASKQLKRLRHEIKLAIWLFPVCYFLSVPAIYLRLIVTAVILLISNVQLALFSAVGFSYAVMILHSSFRKLTLAKQLAAKGGCGRIGRR